jgi:hypothetical protein
MISQKVKKFANDNGYDFHVSGLGYRQSAQITTFEAKPHAVSRCSNNSKDALQAINTLIAQRKLDAKSNEAIAAEAEQAYEDLLPVTPAICTVEAEQAYQELQPVAPDRRRFYERTSYMGVGIEVYCGDERYGYALAELLERPLTDHPMPTYTPRDDFGDDAFVFSARHGCGALI